MLLVTVFGSIPIFGSILITGCMAQVSSSEYTGPVIMKVLNIGGDKYLGVISEGKEEELGMVEKKKALKFSLKETKYATEKFLEGSNEQAVTKKSNRRFIFFGSNRDGYNFDSPSLKSKEQRFRLTYYAPNDYVIMYDKSCLGVKKSIFVDVECTNPAAVAHFKMCDAEKGCSAQGSLGDVIKDVIKIKQHLMGGGASPRTMGRTRSRRSIMEPYGSTRHFKHLHGQGSFHRPHYYPNLSY